MGYKFTETRHAVDAIAYEVYDKDYVNIALIIRKYSPFGYALAGGFIDEGESKLEAAKRELLEELNLVPVSDTVYETSYFTGRDSEGKLWDPRGEVTTQGFTFECDLHETEAKDDADAYVLLRFDLSKDIQTQVHQELAHKIAMPRHLLLITEGLEILKTKLKGVK